MTGSEERHSSNQPHRQPGHFHPYASNDKSSHQLDQKSSIPAWKQIRERQQRKKSCGKPSTFHRNQPRVLNRVNDIYCVKCATGLKDCACVPGQLGLNPSPVMAKNRDLSSERETVNLLVNYCVANAHSVTGLSQKERHKSQLLSQLHRNKIHVCERCFLCRSFELCKSCHKYPNCCHRSTCRGKATPVMKKMGNPGGESKSSNSTQRGLHPSL